MRSKLSCKDKLKQNTNDYTYFHVMKTKGKLKVKFLSLKATQIKVK